MKTLLIVDDEAGLADALSEALTEDGYRVFTALNGKRGLEVLVEARPDLLILDYMMPIQDGPAMLHRLRALPAFANLPVAMISALSESVVREDCPDIVGFLRKPFSLKAIIALIERLVGKP